MKKMKYALAGIILISVFSCRKAGPDANVKPLLRVVSTFAGNPFPGYLDGAGRNSAFNHPGNIVVDTLTGNIFVADQDNSRIRKITAEGVVSTVAGTGAEGYLDGPGNVAQFNKPSGITIDKSCNLYVTELRNDCIRKITPAGMVSTFAGGVTGYADGTGTNARFNWLHSITIDAADNLYVVDRGNIRIRKISSAGVVTTLAGSGQSASTNGQGTAASFEDPLSIAVDAFGNICVSDNAHIRKITPGGAVSFFAGGIGWSTSSSYSDGAGPSARMGVAWAITADNQGNLYVADWENHLVRKVSAGGYMSTYAGTPGIVAASPNAAKYHKDGLAEAAMFYWPRGISADNKGNVFVAEGSYSGAIRQISNVAPPDTPEEKARKNWNKPNRWN